MEKLSVDIKAIAKNAIRDVFRTDTSKPGFIHIDLGEESSSSELRATMVALKKELSSYTKATYDRPLSYHWLVRFDQQVNTPFHVDNAANQSFLMLGYEPTPIQSELYIGDYHKYARECKDAPKSYLKDFTPVFENNHEHLKPYITKVETLSNNSYSIVLINNSVPTNHKETLGAFHKATMRSQDFSKERVVNSMIMNMLAEHEEALNEPDEQRFITTSEISK
jgi:hypothetical protein